MLFERKVPRTPQLIIFANRYAQDKTMKIQLLVILAFLIQSFAFSQENIFGLYNNNVASGGFFGEELKLNEDSTFNYYSGGDLIHTYGKGNFVIRGKQLTLLFHRNNYGNIDSLIAKGKITQHAFDSLYKQLSSNFNLEKPEELNNKDSRKVLFEIDKLMSLEIVDFDSIQVDSLNFLIRSKKLLCINESGKIIRRVRAYSKRRKFFFWGEKYMKNRKYYLTKR